MIERIYPFSHNKARTPPSWCTMLGGGGWAEHSHSQEQMGVTMYLPLALVSLLHDHSSTLLTLDTTPHPPTSPIQISHFLHHPTVLFNTSTTIPPTILHDLLTFIMTHNPLHSLHLQLPLCHQHLNVVSAFKLTVVQIIPSPMIPHFFSNFTASVHTLWAASLMALLPFSAYEKAYHPGLLPMAMLYTSYVTTAPKLVTLRISSPSLPCMATTWQLHHQQRLS